MGDDDWHSNPNNALAIGEVLGASVTVLQKIGHPIELDYVRRVLGHWLDGWV